MFYKLLFNMADIDLLIDEDEKNATKFAYYIELLNLSSDLNMLSIEKITIILDLL